eukprot:jgi/Botrbrau1/17181/Bobra.0157s0072.1
MFPSASLGMSVFAGVLGVRCQENIVTQAQDRVQRCMRRVLVHPLHSSDLLWHGHIRPLQCSVKRQSAMVLTLTIVRLKHSSTR